MKLYYSPGACSLSPHIILEETGLACELVLASTKTHKLPDGTDYYSINPLGYVPVLELDDGTRLHEGPVVAQYLANQVPQKNLVPAHGTMAYYHMLEWLTFIGTEVHKAFSPLFNPATTEDAKPGIKAKIVSRLQWVDSQLAGKQYLLGDHFSIADAYLFTITNWAGGTGTDISQLKNLAAYRERVAARPAVQAAMKAEGLIK